MKILYAIIPLLIWTCFLHAQKVVIAGEAKGYEDNYIEVFKKRDYISNIEKRITFSLIDSVGNFVLEFEALGTDYITIKVNRYITSMYVVPDKSYEIKILPPDTSTYHNTNLIQDVDVAIKLSSKTDINALTMDFEEKFDDFLSNEYLAFVKRNPKKELDSFKTAINQYYTSVTNPFFKSYITYSFASMEEKINTNKDDLFKLYLNDKPILYSNPEYMNFFNTFYKGYFVRLTRAKNGIDLYKLIEKECNYSALMDSLKQVMFLNNDSLRELVIIKGLYESYHARQFYADSIVSMLNQIHLSSNNQTHKKIAKNILNSFSKLIPGAKAPFFELPNVDGATQSLDEMRAYKYVYLSFFKIECTACLQQMKVISSLHKRFGRDVEFVSVCLDEDLSKFERFCESNPEFKWKILYNNAGVKLLKDYEISSLPTYFLIAPDGTFVQVPADSPEEYISRVFYDLTKPKPRRYRVGDKRNY